MEKQASILSAVRALNQYIRSHELSDFRAAALERGTLRLVGSFDLCYYHDVEITVTGVTRLALDCEFYVDLAQPEPFSVCFSEEETAILRFPDCGTGRTGEVWFEGWLSFLPGHVSYGGGQ